MAQPDWADTEDTTPVDNIPIWVWIATAIGALAALATTGAVLDAAIGGALWFGIAFAIAYALRRGRAQRGD